MKIGISFKASMSNGAEFSFEIVLGLTALIWLSRFFV